ncbi:MAG: PP2C family protein-serine/threonine phosphatase [Planctomycetota bacterium]|jgi:sigma-B regulation protein RsbU (phosphoserine phosphatase)
MDTPAAGNPIATAAPPREEVLAGMACVDTSGNPRIPMLMEMVGALSRAREPADVLRTFGAGMSRLYGPRGYVSLSTRGLAPGEYRVTRLMTEMDPDALAAADVWAAPDALPVHRGGFFGEIIRTAYPEIIHHLTLRDDPVVGNELAGFGSLMAVPLFDDGEPLNWAITLRREPEGFTEEELEAQIIRANLVGGTVKNTVMARELRAAHGSIRREMEQIGRIQRALLPSRLPDIPGVSIAASYETFDTAGGDMYDFERLDGDGDEAPWAVLIADASGHGPAAATVVAMLNGILYAAPRADFAPARILAFANRHLHAKRLESTFVTALLGVYDPPTRRFTYARAGHDPALLMTPRDGELHSSRLDGVGGVPLGVLEEAEYETQTVQLERGQTLVLYTDGITEAVDPSGRQFGLRGIERSLTECTGAPDCAINHIAGALRAHQAGHPPKDDQTIIAIRID